MTTPGGPGGSSYNRPPAAVARVHEKFTPSSEWKQGKESDILLIFLPDFLKQNIKVTTETGNILRVTGTRPVAGNKLSRFQQDFEIPKNCIIKAIRAKFEGGILTITFPRIANTAATTATTVTTTNEKPKTSQPSPTLPPSQKQDKQGPTSQTTETAIPRKPALPTDPALKEPTSQTTEADIPSTPALPVPELKELKRSRFQTPSPPKPTNASNFTSNAPKTKPRKFIESSRPPLVVDDTTPLLPTPGTGKGFIREEISKAKDDVKNEKTVKHKESELYQSGFEKSYAGIEKVEDVQTKGKNHNENDEKVINKIVEKTDQVDFKPVMKSIGRRVNEEKELVLNMGAAIMVIVGLGAYVYHSFSSAKLAKR